MPDYARTELERRFLLERLPLGLDPDGYELFHDLFVAGTHVRFRRIEGAKGTMLAEVEAASIEPLEAIPVPSWAAREVTADPRYRSFALAST